MFEPMLETLNGWVSYLAESVVSVQETEEPLERQNFTQEDMERFLFFLRPSLSYGHDNLKEQWAHTPHQADQVIQCLHNMGIAVLFGATKDERILSCFLEKKGFSILAEALLAAATPESIRAQCWQSLSLILHSAKEEILHRFLMSGQLNELWSGEPDLGVEEHRMHFVACIKKVCMEVPVAGLPYLMTDDGSIPILKAVMPFTAHDEALVRTQARSAMLTLFTKLKMGESKLLHIALDMAKSMLPTSLCTLMRENWSKMEKAAREQNARDFQKCAFLEEDLLDHFADLIKLQLPDLSEMVCGIIMGSLVSKLSCVSSRNRRQTVGASRWNSPFVNIGDDSDSEAMMAIPSPGAFLSPKTETESTGSVSVEQPSLELFTAFAACGLESAVKVESSFADGTSDISAALAMRTLAVYAGCLRHGQIGCALMPLAELLFLPAIPASSIRAMEDLNARYISEELLALTEQFAAGAIEDCNFIPKEGAHGIPIREEVETKTKDRLEHWRESLRTARSTSGPDMWPNPFREAILEQMRCTAGIPVSDLPLRATCNTFSFQSVLDEKTAATLAIAELTNSYPDLLEHAQLLEDSPPHVVIEDPEFAEPAMPTNFAEAFAWIFKAGGNGCSFISL